MVYDHKFSMIDICSSKIFILSPNFFVCVFCINDRTNLY